ncbi:PIN domain-containing protein [Microcystis aeruginosa NIES-298]|uniref:PilT-like protein n=1 Tax=Microcystis aeruginosa NIES-298 TaxID=449468 RepID=A0A2H6BX61_MICAE|nr:type II toxin-antitoxin system VapC family toxin [Microcystis aeruginosa]MBE9246855.1 type II toxin-antitoxin system VapC family toxin [Microcystis aeruginosa LEGE 00239]QHU84574.1 PIN domain-containing protein [Microcystis aeruginosa NIES-298]GBD54764.1 PilT-like protein [Microcystis aeruginosa NIES-298]GBE96233.1 twitching motility protein PilT [Microcystis aeruginosa NIES-298]
MKQALLDTNILSYFLRGNPAVIEQFRIYRQHYTYISFSIFTYYEIKSGLLYKDARNQQQQFERLVEVSEVIGYDREISDIATQIYVNLRIKGQLITPIDLFIAATAICCDYTLITANIKHFQNIPNLSYENWYLSII